MKNKDYDFVIKHLDEEVLKNLNIKITIEQTNTIKEMSEAFELNNLEDQSIFISRT